MPSRQVHSPGGGRFRHKAAFYHGLDGLATEVLPFIQQGVDAGEPVIVAMLPDRIETLEQSLGPDAARVRFLDMAEIGANPARILPAWRHFVESEAGRGGFRGVGEPIWPERRADELVECRLHEALLNVAFDEGPAWQLMCPYDMDALPSKVLEDAMRTHPDVSGDLRRVADYGGHQQAADAFAAELSTRPQWADEIPFRTRDLLALRRVVGRLASRAGLPQAICEDLVLATHELAANSLKHGGGSGLLRSWSEPAAFVIEVSDSGTITDPLVGRDLGSAMTASGRGLWMANQLCDLVQVRSTPLGTVVRLFAWL